MTNDDAFLASIAAAPLDDLRRLVYADWLDEHGRSDEAEYLRLVAALAEPGTPVDVQHTHARRVMDLTKRTDGSWRRLGCGRFDLWVDEYDMGRKIVVIKTIRELTGYGLAEAKAVSESLPKVLSGAVPVEEAIRLGDRFAACSGRCRIQPSREIPSGGLLRYAVVIGWGYSDDPLLSDSPSPDEQRRALAELRRVLHNDPEFQSLSGQVPNRLPPDADSITLVLQRGLLPGEAEARAQEFGTRLLGGVTRIGAKSTPPFWGAISISTTWC